MRAKLLAALKNPTVTHSLAALAPVLTALVASAVAHYPLLAPVVAAVCGK